MLISVIACIPIMLLTKPCLFSVAHKKAILDGTGHIELVSMEDPGSASLKKSKRVASASGYQELDEE